MFHSTARSIQRKRHFDPIGQQANFSGHHASGRVLPTILCLRVPGRAVEAYQVDFALELPGSPVEPSPALLAGWAVHHASGRAPPTILCLQALDRAAEERFL